MQHKQLQALIQELLTSHDEGRRKAAQTLQQLGEPGGQVSVQVLLHELLHETLPLRVAAGEILGEWGEYVTIEPLLLAMQNADEQVRLAAKWALAKVGASASPEHLSSHLAGADAEVKEALLLALGAYAPVVPVLEAISAPEESLREAAIYLIGLLKEHVPIEPLIHLLQSRDAHLRTAAANALGNLEERIPVEPLTEALHDTNADVRLKVIKALANSGVRMPGAELHVLLEDTDPAIRWAATKALVRIGDPTALAIVVESLHSDHEWARENALIRLVESTSIEIQEIAWQLPTEELLRLLKDEWWPVGEMAARILAARGEQAPFAELLALLSSSSSQTGAALRTLAYLGEHVPLSQFLPIEPVLTVLASEEVEIRRNAAEVLGYFGSRVPVEKLLPLIEEDDTCVARTVAKLGRQEGIDVLVANLRTRDQAWFAAKALGEIGVRAPVEPLLAALHISDRMVRQVAAKALYQTHPELLPQLVPELAETLYSGQVGPQLEALRHVLVARALAALYSSQPALLTWFDHCLDAPDWERRMWGALGLKGMMPNILASTMAKLQRLLDDPESASVRDAVRYVLRI